ncbi:MAG TPA: DUF3311 domain-containing protein [Candidatus Dormibacteraeota bacterium]|jgi:fatty acid desaturase
MRERPDSDRRGRWARILLIVPFIALLFPTLYAHSEPRVAGIPFFIWYQFLWVILGVGITGLVYALSRGGDEP